MRSDNVGSLNPQGIQAMWEFGVKAVIDLRSPGEVARRPSPFEPPDYGPLYLHVPVMDDEFAEEVARRPAMPDRYRMIVDNRKESMARVVSTIAQVDGPLVFHCFAGKDRTGLIAAMLLSVAGVSREAIGTDYAETDLQMASRYQDWLAAAPPERLDAMRDELRCPPEWILGELDHVDRTWGGVEAYLAAGGLKPQRLDQLRTKLAG